MANHEGNTQGGAHKSWLSTAHGPGGPVRMVVPHAHGFKSVRVWPRASLSFRLKRDNNDNKISV
jgi:hypothetical protein